MKKAILTLFVSGLMLTSCMKSKTCTCTINGSNQAPATTKRTSNSKKDLQDFEDACNKSTNASTSCVIS